LSRYFRSVFGRYFPVFSIPIPKENSVGTFRYKKGGSAPLFPQKGGNGPLFEKLNPFWKKGGTKGGKYTKKGGIDTDRNTENTANLYGKIPIPKKLLVTPRYNSRHIPTHTDMGSPHISMGIALFLLFSVTHKIGLFSPNRQQHSKHFYSDPHF
jgi:hypothetical protein